MTVDTIRDILRPEGYKAYKTHFKKGDTKWWENYFIDDKDIPFGHRHLGARFVSSFGQIFEERDGRGDGGINFYDNGNLKAIYNRVDARPHGTMITFDENGVVCRAAEVINGKKEGVSAEFNYMGQLISAKFGLHHNVYGGSDKSSPRFHYKTGFTGSSDDVALLKERLRHLENMVKKAYVLQNYVTDNNYASTFLKGKTNCRSVTQVAENLKFNMVGGLEI